MFLTSMHCASDPIQHLTPQHTLGQLLDHPAFAGFAPLLLPWDDRRYDPDLPLARIASLLPYHSHVDPPTVVASLNRMIDDAVSGRTVFYDFYTPAQKREQPSRERTGLFFFRGKPDAPFAVIAPGGGFSYVGSVHEGFPYAQEISRRGLNAFVLKYRAGQGEHVATQDLAAALTFVFGQAAALGVGTNDYSVWGSSAGARMAAHVGSAGVTLQGSARPVRPACVVMLYTGHSAVSADEPPTFVVVGERDGIAPPSTMQRRIRALRSAGTPVEYHEIPGLGHGFGLGTGTAAEGWIDDAVRFWTRFIKTRR
jgi:acetyl esterase/lipase